MRGELKGCASPVEVVITQVRRWNWVGQGKLTTRPVEPTRAVAVEAMFENCLMRWFVDLKIEWCL